MLVPASLSQRAAAAAVVVEARVAGQQAVADARGNIFTLSELEVYKVFAGQLPAAGVRLAEPGGTLGLRREEVTGTAELSVGQQGVFFLEPNPAGPDRQAYRLVAGPQGFVRYEAGSLTAAEPFARYRSIEEELYPAVERSTGQRLRQVKTNAQLEAVASAAKATAARGNAPIISAFLPATISAGTGSVLTITGSGFGTQGGSSKVEFLNADQGGQSYVAANAVDYVLWSDTQIQVRVPSKATGGGAGSGVFRVTDANGLTASSPAALSVVYSYSNIGTPAVRARLVNDDAQGGYTLQYDANFAANTAARGAFERALTTWKGTTRLNLRVGATASTSTVADDEVNIVRFDTGSELPANVLGRTTSRYRGCITGGVTYWSVVEMDYIFSNTTNWNFAAAAPASGQYDFESVALHEQGHAHQLGHIIRPGAVMHYAIANGQQSRTLSLESDVAAGLAVIDFSLNSTNPCGASLLQLLPSTVLPVELLSFAGRYEPALPGVQLRWETASEQRSAYFAVEASDDPTTAGRWREVARVAAAGQSTVRRQYTATDARALAAAQVRYYRLRQVDIDGPEHFSEPVAVSGSAAETELQAFPNPANDVLRLRGPVVDNGAPGQVRLLDAAGRVVRTLPLPAATSVVEVPVADLRNGVYLVQWQAGNGSVLRQRVLVQH
ncbi:hypothetical protein GCM10027048_01220 [Hymenobacter coalescens]